jgi:nitrile hydratase subunit beta
MNGVHDMGGMQCMGKILHEQNEPVFHERWEGRMEALYRAMGAWHKWNIDSARYERCLIPPAEYLGNSYYENSFLQVRSLLVKRGLVTLEEIESSVPAQGSAKLSPALKPDGVLPLVSRGTVAERNVDVAANFKAGQPVRARNVNPVGHTRLPRYARGKLGMVERDHGMFVFPDTNAQFSGEKPQHVYSVRFSARELWGPQAPQQDCVHLDLWDDYLEPA